MQTIIVTGNDALKECSSCSQWKSVMDFYPGHRTFVETNCKSCARARRKGQHADTRREVIQHYGGKCCCCGQTNFDFLSIDHIRNDGALHRKELKYSIYRWLKSNNYPDGFQLLCFNCNCAKGFFGRCPHKDLPMDKWRLNARS